MILHIENMVDNRITLNFLYLSHFCNNNSGRLNVLLTCFIRVVIKYKDYVTSLFALSYFVMSFNV